MWNRFVAGLFYTLATLHVLVSLWLHSGPQEMLTETLSREELYTMLGAGFLFLALFSELMIEG